MKPNPWLFLLFIGTGFGVTACDDSGSDGGSDGGAFTRDVDQAREDFLIETEKFQAIQDACSDSTYVRDWDYINDENFSYPTQGVYKEHPELLAFSLDLDTRLLACLNDSNMADTCTRPPRCVRQGEKIEFEYIQTIISWLEERLGPYTNEFDNMLYQCVDDCSETRVGEPVKCSEPTGPTFDESQAHSSCEEECLRYEGLQSFEHVAIQKDIPSCLNAMKAELKCLYQKRDTCNPPEGICDTEYARTEAHCPIDL